jgi:HK97 family phage major capsid protein
MNNVKELRERLVELRNKMNEIIDTAEAEERDMTPEEVEKINQLKDKYDEAEKQLEARQKVLEIQAKRDRQSKEKEPMKISKRYNLAKALNESRGGKLSGLEAELHQEAEQEARQSGVTVDGLGIPSQFIEYQKPEKRDMVVGTNTAGGHTVETSIGELIPILRPRLQVMEMGATMLTGLQGNVEFPRQDGMTDATEEGETDANAESTPTMDNVAMSPKRAGLYTQYSKQLLAQSTIDVDSFVRRDIEFAISKYIDSKAINGSGATNIPTGILNTAGVNDINIGTNGGNLDWARIVQFETEIAADNADVDRMGWLTTPGVRGFLKSTEKASNTAQFIMMNQNELLGYALRVSTQVPSNLTKGSGTGLHAMIFGNWADLLIGQWGGVDLVVDPYSNARNAKVELVINVWFDVAVRHPESFAICDEIDASIAELGA